MNQPLNHMSLHPATTSTPAPQRAMAVSQPNLGKQALTQSWVHRCQLRDRGPRSSPACPSTYLCTQRAFFAASWLPYLSTTLAFFSWPLLQFMMGYLGFTLHFQHALQVPLLRFLGKNHIGLLSSSRQKQGGHIAPLCEFGPWRLPKGTILASNPCLSFLLFFFFLLHNVWLIPK